jgi:ribosomal protein S18 acetylase RimI-like enzyme
VCDGAELVAWSLTRAKGDGEQVDIDVVAADPAIAEELVARAVRRAAEIGRDYGRDRVEVRHSVYRVDTRLRELLAGHGFAPGTAFHRMRADHAAAVAAEPPPGVVLRQGIDPTVRRAGHEIWLASFADHFGFVPVGYEPWHAVRDSRSVFSWSQLRVAELDGRPVGVLECTDQFAADDNCGYVTVLGVVPAARGRGVAKYLLQHAFAVDAAAGRTGTILHVDSNNTTPALRLYESVGMRPVLVVDVWQRVLETGL